MQFAPIVPYNFLHLVKTSPMHLVLPQGINESPRYAKFYEDVDGYKILDNGAAESEAIDGTELPKLAALVGADEIVVPDVLGDMHKTVRLAEEFRDIAQAFPTFKYQVVAQGSTRAEVWECIQYFTHYIDYASILALPRHLFYIDPDFRERFMRMYGKSLMFESGRWEGVHMLGSNAHVREIQRLAKYSMVRSMDSSLPVTLAYYGDHAASYDFDDFHQYQRPVDFFHLTGDYFDERVAAANIRTFRRWSGEEAP